MSAMATLLGGLGLFLLGMRLMTEGLKLAAGEALRTLLQAWTRSHLRGLAAGALITAIVQSSSVVTVAVIGFVNAGLLTLAQAIWLVFGANVGTTMTSWLVALVGIKVDVAALALPLLGVGMVVRVAAGSRTRWAGSGEALAGFGAFFLGVGFLQAAFEGVAPRLTGLDLSAAGATGMLLAVGAGALLTMLTQSSSAAMALTLTASAAAAAPLPLAAAVVVGTNIGTTSTALLAAIGATPPARRVASAHVAFNLMAAAGALVLLPLFLAASEALVGVLRLPDGQPTTLAVFHTLFNLAGVALIAPLAPLMVARLARMFVTPAEQIGRLQQLDANLLAVPALAVSGLTLELARMRNLVFDLLRGRIAAPRPNGRDAAVRGGLVLLGSGVREFISALNARALPPSAVEAMPDLLRALQHLEDLTALSESLDGPPPPADPALAQGVSDLREVVLAILAESDAEAAAHLGTASEQAYQRLKAKLLTATAQGRLAPPAMEALLSQAQAIRRCGEVAIKTRRRLSPWEARVGDAQPA